jgi:hypothetical protein
MPITNETDWNKHVNANTDPYGKACIDVGREVMRLLDEDDGPIDTHKIICDADKNVGAGGITGFMAGAVASMVSGCHSRGDEFRRIWNGEVQIGDEGDKANESGGVLNPAVLNVACKK